MFSALFIHSDRSNPYQRRIHMIRLLLLVGAVLSLVPVSASAQVLGACGTSEALEPAAAPDPGQMTRVPLPGEQAPNFELPAVVGDEITKVRLSDYDGKWRVVCFYPADFTFV
jgi:peroxiredoxin (alkyl hydroperoxide reductase subunit C)